jgi:thymidylate kinase
MVISDRYYPDLLCDPRRYRYSGSLRLAEICFKALPRPQLTLFLITDADTILARKKEVERSELVDQLGRYRELARKMGSAGIAIDVSNSPDQVIEESYQYILDLFSRYRK